MTEEKENKIKIEDLPEAEKDLSTEEAKNVKGGVDGADFLTWQRQKVEQKPIPSKPFTNTTLDDES